jgi:hypothetical protein
LLSREITGDIDGLNVGKYVVFLLINWRIATFVRKLKLGASGI